MNSCLSRLLRKSLCSPRLFAVLLWNLKEASICENPGKIRRYYTCDVRALFFGRAVGSLNTEPPSPFLFFPYPRCYHDPPSCNIHTSPNTRYLSSHISCYQPVTSRHAAATTLLNNAIGPRSHVLLILLLLPFVSFGLMAKKGENPFYSHSWRWHWYISYYILQRRESIGNWFRLECLSCWRISLNPLKFGGNHMYHLI
jgi:hypothetical protein